MEKTFLGRERMTIDVKGRVPIPARFLSVLRALYPDQWQNLGVLVSPEKSLMIMPLPIFEQLTENWDDLNHEREADRLKMNLDFASADVIELDNQNRLKLTPAIIEDCDIDMEARAVVFTGGKRFIQMWDEATWKQYRSANQPRLSQINDMLARRRDPAHTAPTVFYQELVPRGQPVPQAAPQGAPPPGPQVSQE